MNGRWNDGLAQTCQGELALRVYTSRLPGQGKSLGYGPYMDKKPQSGLCGQKYGDMLDYCDQHHFYFGD